MNVFGFVGLSNQGATCYLNSMLQTLFMTPEFRNAIYRRVCRKSIPRELQNLFIALQVHIVHIVHIVVVFVYLCVFLCCVCV